MSVKRQGGCSHTCWVQVLGCGHERAGLAPTELLGCVCSKPQLLAGGRSHLNWHNANARSSPWLGMAARLTGRVEMLHAGDADSGPGGISLNPTCSTGFTSSRTPRASLRCSLCFGNAMLRHQPWLCVGVADAKQYLPLLAPCCTKAAVLSAELSWPGSSLPMFTWHSHLQT